MKYLKNNSVKLIVFATLLFVSALLLVSGYISLNQDKYINSGFSYLYISIIYLLIYLIFMYSNSSFKNMIVYSAIFIVCITLAIFAYIKYNSNIEMFYRYIFAELSIISFIYLFKYCYLLLNNNEVK